MTTTIDQQVALDEALVPSTQRLRIRRRNFRLPSDIQSKESTLQVVYDVLRNSPFFRAFLVTADVLEIYVQEFWATAKLHHNYIRFKMDTKKSVLDLEAFREMLHISPRIPSQSFAELPFEEEILEFLWSLGHSDEIRHLTDVNVNKLYQPWRSFTSVINKCLTDKSSGIDSFRLSQAQILWGFYHRINIDFAYLIWEYFVYQVEHKSQKRSNEMNYPRFTKVIIDYFITRKTSISRRNRINWHYVRDDALFSTIKVVSRHQTTQQYGAILPIELTTAEIRNIKAYKEYHACAMGEAAPKPKARARKKKGDSASSTTPPTLTPTTTIESAPWLSATAKGKQPSRATTPAAPKPKASARKKKGDSASSTTTPTPTPITTAESAPRLSVSAKSKRPLRAITTAEPTNLQRTEAEQLKLVLKRSRHETHISQQSGSGTGEGTGSKPGVPDVPSDDSEEELLWKSSEDEEDGGQEEGNESNDDSDEGSDKDSEETVKSGTGKDSDEDDDENDNDDDEEAKETDKGGDEVRDRGGESEEEMETSEEEEVSFDPIPRT
nr:hypothetical protein [Tanacetum cinerariifolium]